MEIQLEHIIGVLTVLCGTIGAIWAALTKSNDRERERLHKCEEEREKDRGEIKELFGQVSGLRERMEGVESLSRSVLEKLEGINSDDTTKNR